MRNAELAARNAKFMTMLREACPLRAGVEEVAVRAGRVDVALGEEARAEADGGGAAARGAVGLGAEVCRAEGTSGWDSARGRGQVAQLLQALLQVTLMALSVVCGLLQRRKAVGSLSRRRSPRWSALSAVPVRHVRMGVAA